MLGAWSRTVFSWLCTSPWCVEKPSTSSWLLTSDRERCIQDTHRTAVGPCPSRASEPVPLPGSGVALGFPSLAGATARWAGQHPRGGWCAPLPVIAGHSRHSIYPLGCLVVSFSTKSSHELLSNFCPLPFLVIFIRFRFRPLKTCFRLMDEVYELDKGGAPSKQVYYTARFAIFPWWKSFNKATTKLQEHEHQKSFYVHCGLMLAQNPGSHKNIMWIQL